MYHVIDLKQTGGFKNVTLKAAKKSWVSRSTGKGNKLSIILSEVSFKRKGCSSCLRLFCTSCGWNHSFYTSKKVKKHFEVNRRLVYGMRSIGQGASSAKRFCGVMNMPPPPKPNAYQGHNKALMKAAKTVAEETMN